MGITARRLVSFCLGRNQRFLEQTEVMVVQRCVNVVNPPSYTLIIVKMAKVPLLFQHKESLGGIG